MAALAVRKRARASSSHGVWRAWRRGAAAALPWRRHYGDNGALLLRRAAGARVALRNIVTARIWRHQYCGRTVFVFEKGIYGAHAHFTRARARRRPACRDLARRRFMASVMSLVAW